MSSKRSFKRKIQSEKTRLNKILNASITQTPIETSINVPQLEINEEYNCIQESPQTLRQKLAGWFIQYNPSVECCNSLLKILKAENMDVPISVGGLIKDISSIRAIAGKRGLKKGLTDILSHKLLVDFNVEGSHNKQRLLNYPKFVNILFQGTYDENSSEKSFKNTLRDALKLAKNRFFKEKKSIEKAKKSIDSPKDGDSEKVLQLTDNEHLQRHLYLTSKRKAE